MKRAVYLSRILHVHAERATCGKSEQQTKRALPEGRAVCRAQCADTSIVCSQVTMLVSSMPPTGGFSPVKQVA